MSASKIASEIERDKSMARAYAEHVVKKNGTLRPEGFPAWFVDALADAFREGAGWQRQQSEPRHPATGRQE